ncbi:MAG: hypothetical protein UX44_C0006G0008 [candidate division WWE3 bacterium GW2011_GWA1_46_21]|uniref:Glycosyl transferase family 1 domain-containing protein n=3 Tax=Katanobacteria TaxID=422282 RepID=A0A0G1PFG7_UNCKA|nr:MAG: hypothetical protein UX44_C0006G0008 [candidate division WWE3 bacterium GW2011_GWA1_46_21]KKU49409.1 MAG: hypothetical protein UX69_C0002G0011 [candidate division WWE3 bacterium GW2011_GWA2_46_9]KKU51037.1 MAG: hypothetical protein UX73_C0009G0021 [candidate division WWE3 bacterium GW2011_GWC1_47_10]
MLFLVITHTAIRNGKSSAGPYSTVIKALESITHDIEAIKIPLQNFDYPILFGKSSKAEEVTIPKELGAIPAIKYTVDIIIIIYLIARYLYKHLDKVDQIVIIGIDPLSTLPAILFKYALGIKLIFYSVDFNEKRFLNEVLQKIYELADRLSSTAANQVWVVCNSLKEYKLHHYNTESTYIPNSFTFDGTNFRTNVKKRTLKRFVWTGSILTNRQIKHIVDLCNKIQQLQPKAEFWFIPSNKLAEIKQEIKMTHLKNTKVLDVDGQQASRELVSQCDIGIAVYDKRFGSTKYIEPIKIWEYMLCGLPFIISCEPSLNKELIDEGVVYLLKPDNQVPKDTAALEKFISPESVIAKRETCLEFAKKYDANKTIRHALSKLISSNTN